MTGSGTVPTGEVGGGRKLEGLRAFSPEHSTDGTADRTSHSMSAFASHGPRAEGITAHCAALLIRGYQRFLSPYKGFACAHRVHHGGLSCSEFVRRRMLADGFWRGITAARARFRDCRTAAILMANRRLEERMAADEDEKRRRLRDTDGMPSAWQERAGCVTDTCYCAACAELAPLGCLFDW